MTEPAPTGGDRPPDEGEEPGGETACALHRVCEVCGGLEDGPALPVCARCGAPRAG